MVEIERSNLGLFEENPDSFLSSSAQDDVDYPVTTLPETPSLGCGCASCLGSDKKDNGFLSFDFGQERSTEIPTSNLLELGVTLPEAGTPLATIQGNTVWGDGQKTGTSITYVLEDNANLGNGYFSSTWSESEKSAYRVAVGKLSEIANITFVETTDVNQATFSEAIAPGDVITGVTGYIGVLGYHTGPGNSPAVGRYNRDYWSNTNDDPGGFYFGVLIHELGHGLGLGHTHDSGFGTEIMSGVTSAFSSYGSNNLNQTVYTMMSYNDGWHEHNGAPSLFSSSGNIGGAMALDIAALQNMYGANMSTRTGNDTYTITDGTGSFTSIWDTGGSDTIVASGALSFVLDLRAATLEYSVGGGGFMSYAVQSGGGGTSGVTIANGVVIEDAVGSDQNDTFYGNAADNSLTGNAGDDLFYIDGESSDTNSLTDGGVDIIDGGQGNDTVRVSGALSDFATIVNDSYVAILDDGNSAIMRQVENVVFNGITTQVSSLTENISSLSSIATNSSATIYKSTSYDVYVVDVENSGNTVVVQNNGDHVSVGDFETIGWNPIHASDVGGGNINMIWQNTDGRLSHWVLDESGAQISVASVANIFEAERIVGFDLNGDTIVGYSISIIENDSDEGNSIILGTTGTDNYAINDAGNQKILTHNNDPVSVSFFASIGWHAVHASSDSNGGYNVIFENDDGRVGHWVLDGSGARVSGGPLSSIYDAENAVGFDINDDGTMGYVLTSIENDSDEGNSIILGTTATDNYVINDAGNQKILIHNNDPVSVSFFASIGWHAVHASSDSNGGYNVIFENDDGRVGHWVLDGSGTRVSGGPLSSIYDAENAVGFDINDDGTMGHVLTSVENDSDEGNSVTLSKSTADTYIVNDGSGDDVLKVGNDPVSVSFFASIGWHAVHASSDSNGGYNVIFENDDGRVGHWVLDGSGARVSGGPLSSIYDAENAVGFDINDDGTMGHVLTSVENDSDEGNSVTLSKSTADTYIVNDGSGDDVLKVGNDPVSVSFFASIGWHAVHASSDSNGGYNVIFENDDGRVGHWVLDGSGARVSGGPLSSIYDAENAVGFDINDDGTMGHVLTSVENDSDEGNSVTLSKSTADTYIVNDGSGDDVLKVGNDPVSVSFFASIGWHAVHASSDSNGGYNVIFENDDGRVGHWVLDGSGARVSGGPLSSIYDAENAVGFDINDDGTMGYVLTSIENDSDEGNSIILGTTATDNYVINDAGNQKILIHNNDPVSVSFFASIGWHAVHASSDSNGGYNVIFENDDGRVGHWVLDGSGARVSGGPLSSIYDAENAVGFDINDDGTMGHVLTSVENDSDEGNSVTLSKSTADTYIVNDGSGDDVLKMGNDPVSVSFFASIGWHAVHASSDSNGGYNVIFENDDGRVGHWVLDGSGARVSGGPLSSIYDAENAVGFDINDDGTIG